MIGEKIKQYIFDAGLKYSAVAEKCGIKQSTFSAMMNGTRKITADEYIVICRTLGVSLEQFAA